MLDRSVTLAGVCKLSLLPSLEVSSQFRLEVLRSVGKALKLAGLRGDVGLNFTQNCASATATGTQISAVPLDVALRLDASPLAASWTWQSKLQPTGSAIAAELGRLPGVLHSDVSLQFISDIQDRRHAEQSHDGYSSPGSAATPTSTQTSMLMAMDDGESGPNGTLPEANIVFTNPLDDRIMQAVYQDGSGVYLSRGEKSANGTATSLTQLEFNNITSGTRALVSYDSAGLPVDATYDGRSFAFQWLNGTVAILADVGNGSVLTTVPIPQGTNASHATVADSRRLQGELADPVVEVTLIGCAGGPANAESVTIEVWTDIDGKGGFDDHLLLHAKASPGGVYRRRLPVDASPIGATLEAICEAVKTGREWMCGVTSGLSAPQAEAVCIQFAALAARAHPWVSASAFVSCNLVLTLALGYCKLVSTGLDVPGAPALDSVIFDQCPKIQGFVDRTLGNQPYKVGITVNGALLAYQDFYGEPRSWAVSVVVPPHRARLLSFTTDPFDPDPGESYVANAVLDCLHENDEVRVSIVGTDGYTASRSCSFSVAVAGGSCALPVPGAAAHVVDTLTVSQRRSNIAYWLELAVISIIF